MLSDKSYCPTPASSWPCAPLHRLAAPVNVGQAFDVHDVEGAFPGGPAQGSRPDAARGDNLIQRVSILSGSVLHGLSSQSKLLIQVGLLRAYIEQVNDFVRV